MKYYNPQGQAVYYNCVIKHDQVRYQIQAASGQTLWSRDRKPRKSRTFAQEHQAMAWLERNGYRQEHRFPPNGLYLCSVNIENEL